MKVCQYEDQGGLQQDDARDAYHKREMLGLVADDQHTEKHGHRASQSRPDKQGFFGNAEFDVVFLGDGFIVDADHHRAEGDQGDIGQ